ncbi:MAG: tRNA dihydrouridine(20/20a) synthase DusA [Lautropia sp.]|nr:tRNA dihydrouridine(20/20a) synthase DusA [Lautropia sp.]
MHEFSERFSDRPAFRVSVAPMMDWTDRHCRSFHRLLSQQAWLYTEMVTAQAIAYGNLEHLLGRGEEGGRVVLQLGGNDPALLAAAARQGEAFGYDEINLNCGCPSDRVKEGAFGACLMAEPERVADCVSAMQAAVKIPVTVKHRVGIDRHEDYAFVQRFVRLVAEAGCRRFIVHARNAWLDGLSPKENREIPPLRYEVVHQLRAEFSDCVFELNGGLQDLAQGLRAAGLASDSRETPALGPAAALSAGGALPGADTGPGAKGSGVPPACSTPLDGIMYGRRAYHDPWLLAGVDGLLAGLGDQAPERACAHAVADSFVASEERAASPIPGQGGAESSGLHAGHDAWARPAPTRRQVVEGLVSYLERGAEKGVTLRFLARHVLGLYHGQPGAKIWRRQLSDPAALDRNDPHWLMAVCEQVEAEVARVESVSAEFRQAGRI